MVMEWYHGLLFLVIFFVGLFVGFLVFSARPMPWRSLIKGRKYVIESVTTDRKYVVMVNGYCVILPDPLFVSIQAGDTLQTAKESGSSYFGVPIHSLVLYLYSRNNSKRVMIGRHPM